MFDSIKKGWNDGLTAVIPDEMYQSYTRRVVRKVSGKDYIGAAVAVIDIVRNFSSIEEEIDEEVKDMCRTRMS